MKATALNRPLSIRALVLATGIVIAGVAAYANTLGAPFVFDDHGSLFGNPTLRSLWPPWETVNVAAGSTPSGRPVFAYSLALNYAMGGFATPGYRIANIAIHVLAGLALFGVVRRTLLTERLEDRFGERADILAAICAALFVLHPVQTSAVTYMIQRAESLAGLFYLTTLYCVIRSATDERGSTRFTIIALATCALGMGSKEVMVTAPFVIAAYDRIFLSASWRAVFNERGAMYLGFAGTAVLLVGVVLNSPRGPSAGFESALLMSPLTYAWTQFGVVAHYFALVVWPHPLVLDYADWPLASGPADVAASLGLVVAVLMATGFALVRHPAVGFTGLWFFAILAPTSTIVPIKDVTFDHRLYLSLAGPIALAVVSLDALLARRRLERVGAVAAGVLVLVCGALTVDRNADYQSRVSIWADAAQKRPANWRAHHNLGLAELARGEPTAAIRSFDLALALEPDVAATLRGRGRARLRTQAVPLAVEDYDRAIELEPRHARVHIDRAAALALLGEFDRALADLERAVAIDPNHRAAHAALAELLTLAGDTARAKTHAQRAQSLPGP